MSTESFGSFPTPITRSQKGSLPSQSVTLLATNIPIPEITSAPIPTSSCAPDEVVIELSTVLVIQNYHVYYRPTPILSFQPVYRPLPDGSLILPAYEEDMWNASLSLFVLGGLSAIFLRNILVSGDYLRRGKVKNKTLFYVLFVSQLLAPVSLTPVILSYFLQQINCTIVAILSYLSAMISLALLITGILGVKAYKCLENPRIVPIILALLQCGSAAVVILDLATTRGARRLAGSCLQISNLKYTRYFVCIQFFQSLFICLCFVYACYKSRSSSAARGRISVRLSMDDVQLEIPFTGDDQRNAQRRGWWDYVPGDNPSSLQKDGTVSYSKSLLSKLRNLPTIFVRLFSSRSEHRAGYPRYQPSSREPKTSQTIVKISKPSLVEVTAERMIPGRHSPAPSTTSRFSRLLPRMELFREVLRDELLYTTFITSTCVIVAILVAIGVNFKTCLSITNWIALNWAFISYLTVHSFGRVVHRHEREAWVQHAASGHTGPGNTGPGMVRAATNISSRYSRRTQMRTPSIIPSRNRSLRERYHNDPNDPYSDTRPLDQERFSWQFGTIAPSSIRNPTPLLLSIRNVTPNSHQTQEFEFERAPGPLRRNVSGVSSTTSSPSIYSPTVSAVNERSSHRWKI